MHPDAAKQSSISVSVRVRPFTAEEARHLVQPKQAALFAGEGQFLQPESPSADLARDNTAIRKIVNVVDERMLIFDPPDTSPLVSMQRQLFPNHRLRSKMRDCRFVFDRLFDDTASQQDVYTDTTKPLLDSILDGYNGTVFAYGATGCGKTHTILGTTEDPGVIFLTLRELYDRIDRMSDERVFDVSVLFLEIYNETIRDILSPETPSKLLKLREDAKNKISVSNLLTHRPADVEGIKRLIVEGNRNRTSSPTEANAASSRSHAVLQINVTLRLRTASLSEEHLYATLSIIDLAGSERAANTKNRGATLHEGANINKSLLALGNCINSLCDPRRRHHVPYRDLKLTRLLKFSLGGNCKTVMIVCISPLSRHYDETFNTLRYADRVKEIKTKVVRNRQNLDRHVGSYLKMITEQKQEIEELRLRERTVVDAACAQTAADGRACLEAVLQHAASLRAIVERHVAEKWKKYYVLAKRKLLLLHVHDLDILHARISCQREQVFFHKGCTAVERCFLQIEQLRRQLNEQIVRVEQQYDASSEIEDALHRSREHTLKRLRDMNGWSDSHTHIYNVMFEAVEDHLQNDILLNSSILFDYLVDKLADFQYLPHAFCELVHMGALGTPAALVQAIENASKVLDLMLDSDYDTALEDLTSSYMASKLKLGNVDPGHPVDAAHSVDAAQLKSGHLDPTLDPALDFAHLSETRLRRDSDGDLRYHEKRANSSPLRNSPANKRAIRMSLNGQPALSAVDANSSADLSAMNDDDSPISDRINSLVDQDELTFEPELNSPPYNKMDQDFVFRRPKLLTVDLIDASPVGASLSKAPLLNKGASSKVTAYTSEVPGRDSGREPDILNNEELGWP